MHSSAVDIIAAIADQVGVSRSTVQRILSTELRDTRPTIVRRAETIKAMAREMNYRPNAAARATRTGKFGSIALLLASVVERGPLSGDLVKGIHDELDQTGQRVFVARYSDAVLTDDARVPSILSELNCDGLLINYHSGVPYHLRELVDGYRLPAVWINIKFDHDCVYNDDLGAGRMATEHLLGLGHRRIAYLDFSYNVAAADGGRHYSKDDRLAGYRAAMAAAGRAPEALVDDPADAHEGRARVGHAYDRVTSLLARPDRPTAFVCYGWEAEFVKHAAARRRLLVPEDVSIVTFLPDSGRIHAPASLSGVLISKTAVGAAAARMLTRKIANPVELLPPETVANRFIPGDSVGPAPA